MDLERRGLPAVKPPNLFSVKVNFPFMGNVQEFELTVQHLSNYKFKICDVYFDRDLISKPLWHVIMNDGRTAGIVREQIQEELMKLREEERRYEDNTAEKQPED